jgi:predicted HAD superfamily Cof-like phosphohydrolase
MNMKQWEDLVAEFMTKNGYPPSEHPTAWLTPNVVALRLHLIMEESGELSRALNDKDLYKLADSVADLLYVVVGTAVAAGLGPILDDLFREVHRSNMTKDLGGKDGHRGAIKGPQYTPPDLTSIIDGYIDALKSIDESGDIKK